MEGRQVNDYEQRLRGGALEGKTVTSWAVFLERLNSRGNIKKVRPFLERGKTILKNNNWIWK